MEYYGNLPKMSRDEIKICFFDGELDTWILFILMVSLSDMCHLKPHSKKPKQANLNDVTRQFAQIVKAVDNFHFRKGLSKLYVSF